MARTGRPPKYNPEEKLALVKAFNIYIDKTDIPIIAEFAHLHDIPRSTLYDLPDLSTLLKKAIDKKEANLEIMALYGKINSTMAIFSLKQIGWRDKQDVELTHHKGLAERMEEAEKRVRRLNGQREKNVGNSENRVPSANPAKSYEQ